MYLANARSYGNAYKYTHCKTRQCSRTARTSTPYNLGSNLKIEGYDELQNHLTLFAFINTECNDAFINYIFI